MRRIPARFLGFFLHTTVDGNLPSSETGDGSKVYAHTTSQLTPGAEDHASFEALNSDVPHVEEESESAVPGPSQRSESVQSTVDDSTSRNSTVQSTMQIRPFQLADKGAVRAMSMVGE
ncbi:hypothetical protein B0H17DRAFT_702549 [Mycena rosella]|uniref:Uncharacterized protein n=1 Tax=Mycena rosella TaxID=1033263 RepID=A0AAD7DAF0_MYCRO|nr:hypothetical protein B0H17DRAFT_702549 [Mycena rosella]